MPVKQASSGREHVLFGAGGEAVAEAAQLACVLEASAEKPGNITPRHDFDDTSYEDMLRSAIALGPEMGRAGERGVGETVLAAVRATRAVAGANTNLGIALLLAPLAKAALQGTTPDPDALQDSAPASSPTPSRATRRHSVGDVLGGLTVQDASDAYEAIRLAGAGGVDEPVEHDVRDEPSITLREAMAEAAGRDAIAAEYASGFEVTFELGLPALESALADGLRPRDAIVELALRMLAAVPDTLIARKRGLAAAERVSAGAARVLAAGGVRATDALAQFDASLRAGGNALNPGTTADLVTAVLFVALLDGAL
jgi:triphosphoribosyl-dephospho-CoA synthase